MRRPSPQPRRARRDGRRRRGLDLAALLHPVSPAVFVRNYWERRPFHVRGTPAKFAPLFDLKRFYRLAPRAAHVHARYRTGQDVPRVAVPQIDELVSAGATVCLHLIEQADPALSATVARVKRDLHLAGEVTVRSYLSADGCGFPTHFDARVATTLQIAGRKRWRFSRRPAVPFPAANGWRSPTGKWLYRYDENQRGWVHVRPDPRSPRWASFDPPDEDNFEEVILEPGDLLCLPAGTWHQARAIGTSLALNLAFEPIDFHAFLIELLGQQANARWRQSPPPSLSAPSATGAMPAGVREYFATRLDELRTFLASRRALTQLRSAWHHRVYGSHPPRPPAPRALVSW